MREDQIIAKNEKNVSDDGLLRFVRLHNKLKTMRKRKFEKTVKKDKKINKIIK